MRGVGDLVGCTIVRVEKFWVLVINREDGTANDYRFKSQKAAKAYAARLGMEV